MADLIIDVRSHLVVVVDNVRRHEDDPGMNEVVEQRPVLQRMLDVDEPLLELSRARFSREHVEAKSVLSTSLA